MASEPNTMPPRPTSTIAFRQYLATMDRAVEYLEGGEIDVLEVWQLWDATQVVLVSTLADVLEGRIRQLTGGEPARPVNAEGTSYVHRAHFPSVTPESTSTPDGGSTPGQPEPGAETGGQ
jgi:hypothetical protein